MDTTIRFWDRIAPGYARQPIADQGAYETKLEITRSYMEPGFEVAEFGCGTGGTAVLHAPHVRHITAIDFSNAMLDVARGRARDAGVSNVSFVAGDINDFEMPGESLDMVMAMSLLHLLKDPEGAMARVYGMLKPGGYFVSSTGCMGEMMPVMRYIGPVGKALGLLPQMNVFTKPELVAMIERQGFSIRHDWQKDRKAAVFIVAQKGDRD